MRKESRAVLLALLAIVTSSIALADPMPPALVQAALQHYPNDLLCDIALGGGAVDPSIPITEDVKQGWLDATIGRFTPGGHDYAIVRYSRRSMSGGPPPHQDPFPELKIFVSDGTNWDVAPIAGASDYSCIGNGDVDLSKDVLFKDVNGDGVNELVLYGHDIKQFCCNPENVIVFALRAGVLVPLTGITITPNTPLPNWPSVCQYTTPDVGPSDAFVSDTGVGFVDMDGDGVDELLIYPNLGGDRPEGDAQHGRYFDVPTTGTRVYKLVNGVYTFQYETPVGTSGTPPIGAAMKPASVTVSELEAAGNGQGGGPDEAVTLYVMPPQKVAMDGVDWSTLRIGEFTIAATSDRGVFPAPHSTSEAMTVFPSSFGGQVVLLEDLAAKDQGQFQQSEKDPVVYVGVTGRLHFTTPYRALTFSKRALFAWAWGRWQAGAGDATLKACLPQGNHQRCFTPLHIPVKVNLIGGHGFAMGEAMLWVETDEAAASSGATAVTALPTATPSPR